MNAERVVALSENYFAYATFPCRRYEDLRDLIRQSVESRQESGRASGKPAWIGTYESEVDVFDDIWESRLRDRIASENSTLKRGRVTAHVYREIRHHKPRMLLLLESQQHPESLLRVLEVVDGEVPNLDWGIGAQVGNGYPLPQEKGVFSFMSLCPKQLGRPGTMPMEDYFLDNDYFVVRLLGQWTYLTFEAREAWQIRFDMADDGLSNDFGDLLEYAPLLVEYSETLEPKKPHRSRSSGTAYDALRARLGELKNTRTRNLILTGRDVARQMGSLERGLRFIQLTPSASLSPARLTAEVADVSARMGLSSEEQQILQEGSSGYDTPRGLVIERLLCAEQELSQLVHAVHEIEEITQTRLVDTSERALRTLRWHMLASLQSVFSDLLTRVQEPRVEIDVVHGNDLRLVSVPRELTETDDLQQGSAQSYMAFWPSELLLRLGAYPLAAYLVGKSIILGLESRGELDNMLRTLQETLADRLEEVPRSKEWGIEVGAHAAAGYLVGPAYALALPRFFPGSLASFIKPTEDASQVSPHYVGWQVAIGEAQEIESGFAVPGELFGVVEPLALKLDPALLRVKRPYTDEQHARGVGPIQANLISGRIPTGCESTEVLNALWDAVRKKSGYVNELSALLALADR